MSDPAERYRFGVFEINLKSAELSKGGIPVRLAPQPFRVLELLVRRAGELVTREEIQAAVWSDGTTVEFDQGLNYCIRQIRLALNEDAREPDYIATIPKRGYRFVAELVPVESPDEVEAPVAAEPPARRLRLGWIAGFALVVAVAGLGWALAPRRDPLPEDATASLKFRQAELLSNTWEKSKVTEAAGLYREVIRIEPAFANAYASLANTLVVMAQMQDARPTLLVEAEQVATQALAKNPDLAVAHAALGHCYWIRWDWDKARAEFERALELDPKLAVAHQLYAMYLASIGRAEEAIRHAKIAATAEPTSGVIQYSLAQVYLQTGHFDESIQQNRHTLKIYRHWPNSYPSLFRAYVMKGDFAAADAIFAEWEKQATGLGAWRAYRLAREGHEEAARAALAQFRSGKARARNFSEVAALVALRDTDGALQAAENLMGRRTNVWWKSSAELEPLRADPRFQALLRSAHWP